MILWFSFQLLTLSSCLEKQPFRASPDSANSQLALDVSSGICMSIYMPPLPFHGGTVSFLKLPCVYSRLLCVCPLDSSYLPIYTANNLANNLAYSSDLLHCSVDYSASPQICHPLCCWACWNPAVGLCNRSAATGLSHFPQKQSYCFNREEKRCG